MKTPAEEAADTLRIGRERMREEMDRVEGELARLQAELALRQRQAAWMAGWSFDERRLLYVHADGHTITAFVVSLESDLWAFLRMWYDLYPQERDARNTIAAQSPTWTSMRSPGFR